MKHLFSYLSFLVCTILFFPGCCRYIDWGKKTFKTAETVCTRIDAVHKADVRFGPMRDPFMTIGLPRVMYRSDEVIEVHERLLAECAGMPEEKVREAVAQLQEENQTTMIFYVSLYDDKENWSFSLCKNDVQYEATEIKTIDLDREYSLIFGKAASRYKQNIYRVTFDVAVSKPFSFVLCNGEYRETLSW